MSEPQGVSAEGPTLVEAIDLLSNLRTGDERHAAALAMVLRVAERYATDALSKIARGANRPPSWAEYVRLRDEYFFSMRGAGVKKALATLDAFVRRALDDAARLREVWSTGAPNFDTGMYEVPFVAAERWPDAARAASEEQ